LEEAMREIVALALFAMCARGQSELSWEQHPKLSWMDFKGGTRKVAGDPTAVTDTGFRTQLMCREGVLDIEIKAEFYPDTSWVKPKEKLATLLKHEQGHFDITELYVRKMRKAIRDAKIQCEDESKAESAGKALLAPLDHEWEKAEKQYDADTKDGTNLVGQNAASHRIASELAALSSYAK
jgi:hypothetical protein